ncbi:MAG TPA: dienelactone hydrolase family protein, partial [Candidatus Acidoferrales bacterium]
MKSRLSMVAAILSFALISASLLAIADAPKTETVQFSSGKDTISGFLALPEKPGPHPAMIVIQEWWGLNDWVKEQTVKLAE